MRIDLNWSASTALDRSSSAAPANKSTSDSATSTEGTASDVAQLSTGSDALQNLKTSLTQLPDVRQSKVDALRNAIGNGTFQVLPSVIANAMLPEMG